MAQPTRDQVLTLDYSIAGQPAVFVEAKSIGTNSLDYTLAGQPIVGISPAIAPSSQGNFLMFFN